MRALPSSAAQPWLTTNGRTDREQAHTPWYGPSWAASVHIRENSLDTWRRTPSGFRCVGQSDDKAGFAGWIRCRTWNTYILFWNRRKRCRGTSVSPHLSGQRSCHLTSKNSGGGHTHTQWGGQDGWALRQVSRATGITQYRSTLTFRVRDTPAHLHSWATLTSAKASFCFFLKQFKDQTRRWWYPSLKEKLMNEAGPHISGRLNTPRLVAGFLSESAAVLHLNRTISVLFLNTESPAPGNNYTWKYRPIKENPQIKCCFNTWIPTVSTWFKIITVCYKPFPYLVCDY